MSNHFKKTVVVLIIVVMVFGFFATITLENCTPGKSVQNTVANYGRGNEIASLYPSPIDMTTNTQINAFPGQLVDLSYFLGTDIPSADYYEVTITLNSSSYVTLNVDPTLMNSLTPSGYYLLYSFEMPNDQPGTWWNVGCQLESVETTTTQSICQTDLVTQGSQIWMEYPTATQVGNYMIEGGANFAFSSNVTGIELFPSNPQGAVITACEVNSWTYRTGTIIVNFSAFENVQTNGETTPPTISAEVSYEVSSYESLFAEPLEIEGPRVDIVQGDGAYIMGITSGQIANITNALNQTLSIPLSQLNAAVETINGDTANISTNFGTMVVSLKDIGATIESIDNGQATIFSELGEITVSLSKLNATISGANYDTAVIETNLGQFTASLSSLNASLSSINGTLATIQTDIGTINESMAMVNATVSEIQDGQAIISSSIGQLKTSLKSLNASIVALAGNSATILTSIGKVSTSLTNINASIFSTTTDFPWYNNSTAIIETCLGNISGIITQISNNTTTIETKLGAVTVSLHDLRSTDGGKTPWYESLSTSQIILIALIAATLTVAVLTMINSRSVLRLSGDKDK